MLPLGCTHVAHQSTPQQRILVLSPLMEVVVNPEVCPLMSLLVEEADTEPVPEELLVEEMPLLPVLQAPSESCTHDAAAACAG